MKKLLSKKYKAKRQALLCKQWMLLVVVVKSYLPYSVESIIKPTILNKN